jgi:hypothetical protein
MLGLIIFILIIVYAGKYYRWTERLGYFKSMGITALIVFSVVGLAMIAGNIN